MENHYSGLSNSSPLASYILFKLWKKDNSQRIIIDPEGFDAAIDAAAAKITKKI